MNTTLRSSVTDNHKTKSMNNHTTTSQKEQFTEKHIEYLLDERGIPGRWVKCNFESMTAKEAKGYGFSAPSDGIMLRSSSPSTQWQFRPDKPKVEKKADGTTRARKYETPYGESADAMLVNHPDYPKLWLDTEELKEHCWKVNGHPCLVVTEGFIDALIPTSEGIPTIALTGVENGLTGGKHDKESKRYLVPVLRRFAELGFGFIVGFDADSITNKNVINAQITLVKQLQKFDNPIYNITGKWVMSPDGSDKGIGDYIQKHGADAFRRNVLKRAEPIADWLIRVNEELKAEGINADDELPPKTTKLEAQYTQVKLTVGDKIRFNELTKEIEFNGKPCGFDDFKLELALQFKIEFKGCAEKDFKAIIVKIAKDNSYNPIRNYLDECHEKHSDTSILDNLAKRYFGTNNPLYQTFIRKTLIAAVARIYEPGCKADAALILQGEQGTGKSTFFRVLASDKWFCDDMGSVDDKDQLLKLHASWIAEWAELENIFSKSDISKIKGFLTTSSDRIRMPYGARTESMPRMGVIVGSTNKLDVLRDPTGSRRFWVIPVAKNIPIETLKQERDAIWGAAVQAYKNSESWHLNPDEQRQSNANNEAFSTASPWLDDFENFLEGKSIITTDELLTLMGVEKENVSQAKRAQSEISDIMTQLKWVPAQNIKDDSGKRRRGYKRPVVTVTPEPEVTQPPTSENSCVDSCVNQKPDVEGDTQPTQPTQPINQDPEKNNPNAAPPFTKFKVGDKIKKTKNWTPIGDDDPLYGDVIEVIEQAEDGITYGAFKVKWRNSTPLFVVRDVCGHEIEIDTRRRRVGEEDIIYS